jgi:hypothetical protein
MQGWWRKLVRWLRLGNNPGQWTELTAPGSRTERWVGVGESSVGDEDNRSR